MSYTPTEWKNGDVITAEKLNKLENREDKAEIYIVHHIDEDGFSGLSESYNDIIAALEANKIVCELTAENGTIRHMLICNYSDSVYRIIFEGIAYSSNRWIPAYAIYEAETATDRFAWVDWG